MSSKYVLYQDASIHYTIQGKGIAIILLHGFASDGSIWDNQLSFLEENYMVIIPDIPGSGKSTPLNKSTSTMNDYASCIKAIIVAEKIEKFVLIGHSMGGYIALSYLEKYPTDIIALGLFHSTAYSDNEVKVNMRKKAMGFISSNGVSAFLKTSIPGLFYKPTENKLLIEKLIDRNSQIEKTTLIGYYQTIIDRPDTTHVLKDIAIPILFIAGLHDNATPCIHSIQQSILPCFSVIHILRDSSHMGMHEETAKSNEILSNFLRSI